MRPKGTPQQLEARRLQAVQLLREGKTYQTVAATLNASISSVVRWAQGFRRGGKNALRPKPTPGRPPRLLPKQKQKLLRVLQDGALAAGYPTDLWTLSRIAKLIEKHFGIRYHPGHVWRVMGDLDWTWQKPERRATQRDEEGIERWKQKEWPRIKKSPKTWRPSCLPRRKRFPAHSKPAENLGSQR